LTKQRIDSQALADLLGWQNRHFHAFPTPKVSATELKARYEIRVPLLPLVDLAFCRKGSRKPCDEAFAKALSLRDRTLLACDPDGMPSVCVRSAVAHLRLLRLKLRLIASSVSIQCAGRLWAEIGPERAIGCAAYACCEVSELSSTCFRLTSNLSLRVLFDDASHRDCWAPGAAPGRCAPRESEGLHSRGAGR
jgi:hypothetical protein